MQAQPPKGGDSPRPPQENLPIPAQNERDLSPAAEKRRGRGSFAARRVALVAVCAALIEAGKLALSFLPNVEVVTLLCALFGYVFGGYGILSAAVFVCIEPLIYGFNTWVISYFLYWPFVSAVFFLLRRAAIRNRWVLTAAAVLLTVWFGVLTSLVDVGLFTGFYERFFYRFGIYYMRGIWFYVVQILCNLFLFPTLFLFLEKKIRAFRRRFLPDGR